MSSLKGSPDDIMKSMKDIPKVVKSSAPIQRLIDEIQTLDPSFDIYKLLLQERYNRLMKKKLLSSPLLSLYKVLSRYSSSVELMTSNDIFIIGEIYAIKVIVRGNVSLTNNMISSIISGITQTKNVVIHHEKVEIDERLNIDDYQSVWNTLTDSERDAISNRTIEIYDYLTDVSKYG
jgi:hypothetical protein